MTNYSARLPRSRLPVLCTICVLFAHGPCHAGDPDCTAKNPGWCNQACSVGLDGNRSPTPNNWGYSAVGCSRDAAKMECLKRPGAVRIGGEPKCYAAGYTERLVSKDLECPGKPNPPFNVYSDGPDVIRGPSIRGIDYPGLLYTLTVPLAEGKRADRLFCLFFDGHNLTTCNMIDDNVPGNANTCPYTWTRQVTERSYPDGHLEYVWYVYNQNQTRHDLELIAHIAP